MATSTAMMNGDPPEVLLIAWDGARLRELRLLRGYTQDELAEQAEIANSENISRWEKNKARPGFEDVVKLADALRVSCEAFRQKIGQPPLKSRKLADDDVVDDESADGE